MTKTKPSSTVLKQASYKAALVVLTALTSLPHAQAAGINPAEKEALTQLGSRSGGDESVLTWFNFESDKGISALLMSLQKGKLEGNDEIAAFWNLAKISESPATSAKSKQAIQKFISELRGSNTILTPHARLLTFAAGEDAKETWANALALMEAHGILLSGEWSDQHLSNSTPSFSARLKEKTALDAKYADRLLNLIKLAAASLMDPVEGGSRLYPDQKFARAVEAYRLISRAPESVYREFISTYLLRSNVLAGAVFPSAAPVESLPVMSWTVHDFSGLSCGSLPNVLIFQGAAAKDMPPHGSQCFYKSDRGVTMVKVEEVASARSNASEVSYYARVKSFVHGGYDKSRDSGQRDVIGTAAYLATGSVEIPACAPGEACKGVIGINWETASQETNSPGSDLRTVEVKATVNGQDIPVPAGKITRISRANGSVVLTVRMERRRSHGGGCCTPDPTDQSVKVNVKEYDYRINARLEDRPSLYADRIASLRPGKRFGELLQQFRGPQIPVDVYGVLTSATNDVAGDLNRLRFVSHYGRLFLLKQYLDSEGPGLEPSLREKLERLESALYAEVRKQFLGTAKAELKERQADLAKLSPMAAISQPIASLLSEPVISQAAWMNAGLTIAESKPLLQLNGYELPDWTAKRLKALRTLLYIRDARDALEKQKTQEADVLQAEIAQLETK